MIDIVEDFLAAFDRSGRQGGQPQLVPTRLAAALVEVLPVDGAGLGLFAGSGLRVPIGASCQDSITAERSQFTVGQGPCVEAHYRHVPVRGTAAVMATSWPVYHCELVSQTPFRSVVALPLTGVLARMATLDLLFLSPQAAADLDLTPVHLLCLETTEILLDWEVFTDGVDDTQLGPQWSNTPAGGGRHQVMIAAGMIVDRLGVEVRDALALLRGHAWTTGSTADDLAHRLVDRSVDPAELDPAS